MCVNCDAVDAHKCYGIRVPDMDGTFFFPSLHELTVLLTELTHSDPNGVYFLVARSVSNSELKRGYVI